MAESNGGTRGKAAKPNWYKDLLDYRQPHLGKALWQLLNTFIPYLALWILMVWLVEREYSYFITVAFATVAAALLIRIFIFFHDCTHGSFFASHRANRILGYLTGILTFTPFEEWRHLHLAHHAAAGDLDHRGKGDIWTMTVDEYLAAPRLKRLGYRLARNPLIMLGLGPTAIFLITSRFSHRGARKEERLNVLFTNLAILAVILIFSFTIGLRTYLLIQLPIIFISGVIGIWLFYVQHQFEGVYWARQEVWDPLKAALQGSSYYKLPRVLQWFTGSIGLHHIHHIQPRIPNYNLQKCCEAIPELREVHPLTLRRSLKSLWLNLWDEKQQKLVSFRSLKSISLTENL